MKKIFLILSIFFLIGCNNQQKYQDIMKEYATTFYNKYQIGQTGLTNPTVSIEQLENANKLKNDNFDLKKLDNCTKDSYVEFKIDQNTNEIIATEYHLNCK